MCCVYVRVHVFIPGFLPESFLSLYRSFPQASRRTTLGKGGYGGRSRCIFAAPNVHNFFGRKSFRDGRGRSSLPCALGCCWHTCYSRRCLPRLGPLPLAIIFLTRVALWIFTWPNPTAALAATGVRRSSFQRPGNADLSRALLRPTDHAPQLSSMAPAHMPDSWGVAESY